MAISLTPSLSGHQASASLAPAAASLLLADGHSPDLAPLLLGSKLPVSLVPAGAEPLEAIASALERAALVSGAPVHELHLLAHGRPGGLQLNGTLITAASLIAAAASLSRWRVSRVVLWSCYTGLDPIFTSLLAELSGAAVYSATTALNAAEHRTVSGPSGSMRLEQIVEESALQAWNGNLQSQPIFDVANQVLSFSNEERQPLNGVLSTSLPYPDGTQFLFRNVITIGGQQIDAVITLDQTSTNASAVSNASSSEIDSETLQYSATDSSGMFTPANAYWQPYVTVRSTSLTAVPAFAKFKINFILGGTYVASTTTSQAQIGTAVILQNVILNSYDIDGSGTVVSARQYVELDKVGSFSLTDASTLSVATTATGGMCFKSTAQGDVTALPGTTTGDDVRFQVKYDEISDLTITLGDSGITGLPGRFGTVTATNYTAFFAVDFGTGVSYAGGTPPPEYGIQFDVANNCVAIDECGVKSVEVKVYLTGSSTKLPTGEVLVSLSGFNANEFTISSTDFNVDGQLVFTAADVNNPDAYRIVRIQGVDDGAFDGNSLTTLQFKTSATLTPGQVTINDRYNNLTSFLKVVNFDNDTTVSSATAYECDTAATFSVVSAAGRILNFAIEDVSTTGMNTAPIWVSSDNGQTFVAYTSDYTVPGTTGATTLLVRVGIAPELTVLGEGEETFKLIVTSPGVTCPSVGTGTITSLASLGNRVWDDANANGLQDAGEAGVAGAQVFLLDGNGQRLLDDSGNAITTSTDADGLYSFDCLLPGTYGVEFITPAGFNGFTGSTQGSDAAIDSDADPSTGKSAPVTLAPGANNTSIDAGVYKLASLSGTVYLDCDNSGNQDTSPTSIEVGIEGVTLTLSGTDDLGNPVSLTTTTDASGNYSFPGLRPGTYTVTQSQPAGFIDGQDAVGSAGGSSAVNDVISGIVLSAGTASTANNFGELSPASISGTVYVDADDDGIPGIGEAGIKDVQLTLSGIDIFGRAVSLTTTTDANGFYSFPNLCPGTYTVTQTQPAGYLDGKDTVGSAGGSSAVNDVISGIVLGNGTNSTANNFGEIPASTLSGTVYHDADNDGIKDAGEAGISGVTVSLSGINALGNTVTLSTTTDSDGNYSFGDLLAGTYTVSETQPSTYLDGKDTAGSTGGSTASNDVIDTIVLPTGVDSTANNFGEILPASISGTVYHDADNDGIKDQGEAGIDGVTLTLTGTDDLGNSISLTTTTNASGAYSFTGLRPGTYSVSQSQPASYLDGKDTAGSTPGSAVSSNDVISNIVLTSGASSTANNFGEVLAGSIGDRLWLDSNGDGIQNDGATGLVGRTVTLIGGGADGLISTAADNTTATATTGADGSYLFSNLAPNQYQVRFGDIPTGAVFSAADQGSDDNFDSDASASGFTPVISLASGETNRSLDAGVYVPAAIGNYVWRDANGNGLQEDNEPGMAGVVVNLYKADGVTKVATTTTSASGLYSFSGLQPAGYFVEVVKPSGFDYTSQYRGTSNELDSNIDASGESELITLASGETNNTIDAGLIAVAAGMEISKDADRQSAAPNTAITYTYSVRNTGGVAISNVVVIDDNATPDYSADDFSPTRLADQVGNNDNVLDAGEIWSYSATLIAPVKMTVTLSGGDDDDDDDDDGGTTTTYDSGTLSYTPLANGDIRVTYLQSANFNDNTYGTGSDTGWTSQGKTHKFSDLTGSDKAGFEVLASDGTLLFKFYQDYISASTSNTDGYTSYSGYQSLGISGGDGSLVNGGLLNAQANTYLKDFDSTLETNLNQSGIANNGTGYTAMITNSPINDSRWNDVNGYSFVISQAAFTASGKSFGGVRIFDQHNSPAKVGGDNSYIPTVVGGPSTNTAVVSGLAGGVTISHDDDATVNIITAALASLGDRVWNDANSNGIQDAGEIGLANVAVGLYKADGTSLLSTTTTNSSGNYAFTNLAAGSYVVKVTKPANFIVSPKAVGSNRAVDSNVDSTGKSDVITLAAGANDTSIDIGLYQGSTTPTGGDLQISKDDGFKSVVAGQQVTYTIVATNAGSSAVSNAVVRDTMPTNLTNISWTSSVTLGSATGFTPTSSGLSNININDTISFGPNSSVTYRVTGTVAKPNNGSTTITNTATITGPTGFSDSSPLNNTATDVDDVLQAPGSRTPGYWINRTWKYFWDGQQDNEPKQKGTAGFVTGDLLFAPYNTGSQGTVKDPVTGNNSAGVLVGDWNRNGLTDSGEATIFYSTKEALTIMNSGKQPDKSDVRYTLARSLVAGWLNYAAGNPVDTASTSDKDARHWINQGVSWLRRYSPDENGDSFGDGALSGLITSISSGFSPAMKSSSSAWNSTTSLSSSLSIDAGKSIHSSLDAYNNGSSLFADGNFHGS